MSTKFFTISLTIICFSAIQSFSQTLTKITDANNPVVNDVFNSGGGSWIDVNNDGYLELFVAHGNDASQNNSLYLNDKSGGFIKVQAGALVNDGGTSIGSVWADFNHDGKLDAFVTNRFNFKNFLYLGSDDTVFTKITTGNPVTDVASSNSSSWVDVDNDGDLDLFVVNFGARHFFYRNDGGPNFNLAKIDTGLVLANNGNSIVGAWADYNNDRAPDLVVGNGANENNYLFTNNGRGGFTRLVLDDARSTLGASWGDYDNDGDLDLFVANFLNQNNMLYQNSGAPNYILTPVASSMVANDGGSSVGSAWGDYDNDGDLDLYVANDIAAGGSGRNSLYENSGPPNYSFTKITTGEAVNDIANSFGCNWADYDRDGDLDLFVANRLNQRNLLYRNEGSGNRWLALKCAGTISNRTGFGAKVRVKATINGAARWQMQEVAPQSGYNSQNLHLHFGLGNAMTVDSLKIEWPSGAIDVLKNVPSNQFLIVTEGANPTGVHEGAVSPPQDFGLEQNYPNPFSANRALGNPETRIAFALPVASRVTLTVFDMTGRVVAELLRGQQKLAGLHEINFAAQNLASGVYFYELQAVPLHALASPFVAKKAMSIVK